MHIVKNDDYKNVRAGMRWCALLIMIVKPKKRGKSLIKWNGSTCDTKAIIDFVNKTTIHTYFLRCIS